MIALLKPFNANADITAYAAAVQDMFAKAYSSDKAQYLLALLETSQFELCVNGGPDEAHALKTLATLKAYSCCAEAKMAFVRALACSHGVEEQCRRTHIDPSSPLDLFGRTENWEHIYSVVCHQISGPYIAHLQSLEEQALMAVQTHGLH